MPFDKVLSVLQPTKEGNMIVTNRFGKPFDELDILKLGKPRNSFIVVSEDGVPLYGRFVAGQKPEKYIARNFRNSCKIGDNNAA
jgi:hypothetical protein